MFRHYDNRKAEFPDLCITIQIDHTCSEGEDNGALCFNQENKLWKQYLSSSSRCMVISNSRAQLHQQFLWPHLLSWRVFCARGEPGSLWISVRKTQLEKKKKNNNNKIEIGKLIQIGSKSYIPLDARNLASVLYQVNPTFLLFAC